MILSRSFAVPLHPAPVTVGTSARLVQTRKLLLWAATHMNVQTETTLIQDEFRTSTLAYRGGLRVASLYYHLAEV